MKLSSIRPAKRVVFHIIAGLLIVLGLGACRTTQGLGSDIKRLGSNIEQEAARH
jgi:predicted small secreted protein